MFGRAASVERAHETGVGYPHMPSAAREILGGSLQSPDFYKINVCGSDLKFYISQIEFKFYSMFYILLTLRFTCFLWYSLIWHFS